MVGCVKNGGLVYMSIYSHDDGNIVDNDDFPWGEPLDLDPNEVWDIDAMITSMCSSDG